MILSLVYAQDVHVIVISCNNACVCYLKKKCALNLCFLLTSSLPSIDSSYHLLPLEIQACNYCFKQAETTNLGRNLIQT